MSQVATYGVALLSQLPSSIRSSVLVAITNLKTITFLRVERVPGGEVRYEVSEAVPGVLAALCAVMQMPLDKVTFIRGMMIMMIMTHCKPLLVAASCAEKLWCAHRRRCSLTRRHPRSSSTKGSH